MTLRVGERLEDCLAKINKIVTGGLPKYDTENNTLYIYLLSVFVMIDIILFLEEKQKITRNSSRFTLDGIEKASWLLKARLQTLAAQFIFLT